MPTSQRARLSVSLRGQENLSIETICKIEDALEIELLPKVVEMA